MSREVLWSDVLSVEYLEFSDPGHLCTAIIRKQGSRVASDSAHP